jgi:polysaccharide pyruvyl transferase WcaK-like protein
VKREFILTDSKVLIIHVGHMSNKGTQALLKSDDSLIREIIDGPVSLSVSTTDGAGVKLLNLPEGTRILPTLIDVPYVKADSFAKEMGFSRKSILYKVFSIFSLFLMFVETTLLIFSAVLVKLGLPTFYRRAVLEAMARSDVVVSCSDENFKETASLLPLNMYWAATWWTMLFERMMEVSMARFLKKPIVMFPNSVGPFRTRVGNFLSRVALNNFDSMIIRDSVSYETVEELGILPRKTLTSDTALLFSPEQSTPTKTFASPSLGVCIGVYSQSLSKSDFQNFMDEIAKALDKVVELYGFNVYFFPHYISGFEFDDLDVSKIVFSRMKHSDKAAIFKIDSLDEFKLSLEKMDLLLSSKMHPMVLGMSGYVPTVCIAYDHKQTGFLKDLELEECLVHLSEVKSETIVSKIKYASDHREEIINRLKLQIPVRQEGVKDAIRNALLPFVRVKPRNETLSTIK